MSIILDLDVEALAYHVAGDDFILPASAMIDIDVSIHVHAQGYRPLIASIEGLEHRAARIRLYNGIPAFPGLNPISSFVIFMGMRFYSCGARPAVPDIFITFVKPEYLGVSILLIPPFIFVEVLAGNLAGAHLMQPNIIFYAPVAERSGLHHFIVDIDGRAVKGISLAILGRTLKTFFGHELIEWRIAPGGFGIQVLCGYKGEAYRKTEGKDSQKGNDFRVVHMISRCWYEDILMRAS